MYGSYSESVQDFWSFTRCVRPDGTHYGTSGKCRKGTEDPYADWKPLAQGNYGKVSESPDGTRVVKELLEYKGEKGEFGPYELRLAIRMGKLGHSPVIHRASKEHIEMDLAKGEPLWEGYSRKEGEPVMNAAQAKKAGEAFKALHKLGFFHGDAHARQFMVDGDNVKLVDFGLSGKVSRNPARVLQDLSKTAVLIGWDKPELQRDPYFNLVNRTMQEYRAIKGVSKAAVRAREELAQRYLKELDSL